MLGAGLVVIDMGTHILPKIPNAQLLIQIAVPGLEERARCLPPLRCKEMSPGKLCHGAAGRSKLVAHLLAI